MPPKTPWEIADSLSREKAKLTAHQLAGMQNLPSPVASGPSLYTVPPLPKNIVTAENATSAFAKQEAEMLEKLRGGGAGTSQSAQVVTQYQTNRPQEETNIADVNRINQDLYQKYLQGANLSDSIRRVDTQESPWNNPQVSSNLGFNEPVINVSPSYTKPTVKPEYSQLSGTVHYSEDRPYPTPQREEKRINVMFPLTERKPNTKDIHVGDQVITQFADSWVRHAFINAISGTDTSASIITNNSIYNAPKGTYFTFYRPSKGVYKISDKDEKTGNLLTANEALANFNAMVGQTVNASTTYDSSTGNMKWNPGTIEAVKKGMRETLQRAGMSYADADNGAKEFFAMLDTEVRMGIRRNDNGQIVNMKNAYKDDVTGNIWLDTAALSQTNDLYKWRGKFFDTINGGWFSNTQNMHQEFFQDNNDRKIDPVRAQEAMWYALGMGALDLGTFSGLKKKPMPKNYYGPAGKTP